MRNYRYHRDKGIWFKILGGILVLSFIFTIVAQQQQKKLDVYSETDKVEKKQDVEEEAPEIATYIHTDAENHYSIEIPEEWERVTQDGYDTFIHSASGSSVQIQVKDYDPAINNLTAETASTQVAENGYTFVSFEPLENNSYDLRYQDMKNSTYDYIEEAFWTERKALPSNVYSMIRIMRRSYPIMKRSCLPLPGTCRIPSRKGTDSSLAKEPTANLGSPPVGNLENQTALSTQQTVRQAPP